MLLLSSRPISLSSRSFLSPRTLFWPSLPFLLCHAALCCGIAFLSSTASLKVVLGTLDVERLQLPDDALQFLGERAIENLVFSLPVEFQTATVQE